MNQKKLLFDKAKFEEKVFDKTLQIWSTDIIINGKYAAFVHEYPKEHLMYVCFVGPYQKNHLWTFDTWEEEPVFTDEKGETYVVVMVTNKLSAQGFKELDRVLTKVAVRHQELFDRINLNKRLLGV